MRSRWWVGAFLFAVVMAWTAWVLEDARRDTAADKVWQAKDAALHDSLALARRRIVTLDSAVASLEARRVVAVAAGQRAEHVADGTAGRFAAFRDSALAAERDAAVSRDSVGALLRTMAAHAVAREQAAIEERAAHAAALAADSSLIGALRAGVAARDSALALAERRVEAGQTRIRILEGQQSVSRRVARGVVAYGVSGTCAAVGWMVMGPAGGIASGAVCAAGWAAFGGRD